MAEFFKILILKNNRGQSVVEYILLLVVISAIGFTVYNNQRFKEFLGGQTGFFSALRKGMAYSYRYGRELKADTEFEEAMSFDYQTRDHDTYFNKESGKSRFFEGTTSYGD